MGLVALRVKDVSALTGVPVAAIELAYGDGKIGRRAGGKFLVSEVFGLLDDAAGTLGKKSDKIAEFAAACGIAPDDAIAILTAEAGV